MSQIDALHEHAMFVEGDEFAERLGRESLGEDHVRRPVAFENPVRNEPLGCSFRLHFFGRLAERQRLGLREDVGQEHGVVPAQRVERLDKRNEVAGDEPRALMDQLVEGMLAIGARFAPVDRAGRSNRPRSRRA